MGRHCAARVRTSDGPSKSMNENSHYREHHENIFRNVIFSLETLMVTEYAVCSHTPGRDKQMVANTSC